MMFLYHLAFQHECLHLLHSHRPAGELHLPVFLIIFFLLIQFFMNTNTNQQEHDVKASRDVSVDLEFDHYLFEVFLNDRIENEILRMMEFCVDKPRFLTH
jgi:hypothetical protein